jgi:suppressor of ftsI
MSQRRGNPSNSSTRVTPNRLSAQRTSIGAFHHRRATGETHEGRPFHIQQVHFLIYAPDGVRLKRPEWLDTVNVVVEGNVDLVMDFTDRIMRGVSLFHCHLLSHEDKGMMAKIPFKQEV